MPKDELRKYAERNTGATIDRIKLLSDKYGVAIAGSFIADSGGLLFNRAFFIEPSGEECFADKRHLFSMARENDSFNPGNSLGCLSDTVAGILLWSYATTFVSRYGAGTETMNTIC